ncbi:MAG: hypothetical protein HQL67_09255 [Magnetococcales bacterium]|nr:hypothetical protein [Magnetococcales bacterium]
MAEPHIIYCDVCNPEKLHQEDRRKGQEPRTTAQIIPFLQADRRARNSSRRKVQDRRILETTPPKEIIHPRSKGRRPFDGHTWFVGTVDRAMQEQWQIEEQGKKFRCPRCRFKTASLS